MKKIAAVMLATLLAGCAQVGAPVPVIDKNPVVARPVVPVQPAAPAATVVPKEDEVCIKPEDQSGIEFGLYKPQGDSNFLARPGWTIARPAFQLIGDVVFPKPVDPASVKLSIEPAADWTYRPQPAIGLVDRAVTFIFLPAGGETAEPLNMQWGKPGWITLTVESATAKDGSQLLAQPITLKIFAYTNEMSDTHRYLNKCYSSLGVPPGPNGV